MIFFGIYSLELGRFWNFWGAGVQCNCEEGQQNEFIIFSFFFFDCSNYPVACLSFIDSSSFVEWIVQGGVDGTAVNVSSWGNATIKKRRGGG